MGFPFQGSCFYPVKGLFNGLLKGGVVWPANRKGFFNNPAWTARMSSYHPASPPLGGRIPTLFF